MKVGKVWIIKNQIVCVAELGQSQIFSLVLFALRRITEDDSSALPSLAKNQEKAQTKQKEN